MTERRRHKRLETSHLISYVFIDKEGNEIEDGMGTALNLSQGGLLLETYLPVKAQFILIMYIDLEGQLVKIKGKVVHSRRGKLGNFFVGVRLVDTHESQRKMIVSFIKDYYSRKSHSIEQGNNP
jgi:c-di-GMP-binding flagellar brake protein YcgR